MQNQQSRKNGRPRHEPTEKDRNTVEALAGYGVTADNIAQVIGVSRVTLSRYYSLELERGASMVEAKLIGNLLRLASGHDGTALKAIMFSLNCRFGWSQYAPQMLGKKEAATAAAETAGAGSDWGDDLGTNPALN